MKAKQSLIVAALAAALLGTAGFARADDQAPPYGYGPGPGMMGGYGPGYGSGYGPGYGYGPGMMGGGYGPGYGRGYGPGYGRGYGPGYGMWPGMMGGWGGYGYGYDALNLSDEQRAKITKIQEDAARSQWEIMNKMRESISQGWQDAQKKIDAVLTKEQREQLKRGWGAPR